MNAHDRDVAAGDLERSQDLLERAVQFLVRCALDEESEDPRELIQGLRSLSVAPRTGAVEPEPRTPGLAGR